VCVYVFLNEQKGKGEKRKQIVCFGDATASLAQEMMYQISIAFYEWTSHVRFMCVFLT
jgi:hypothetical protein